MNTPCQPYENALVIEKSTKDTFGKYNESTVLEVLFSETEDFDVSVNGLWQSTSTPIKINIPYVIPNESGDKYIKQLLGLIELVPFDNLSTMEQVCYKNSDLWQKGILDLEQKLAINTQVVIKLADSNSVTIALNNRKYIA